MKTLTACRLACVCSKCADCPKQNEVLTTVEDEHYVVDSRSTAKLVNSLGES